MANLTTTSPIDTFMASASQITMRAALGLGTLATQNGTFSGTSSGTNTGDQDLSGLVPKTTTVNGLPLSGNVVVTTITGNAGTATALQTPRTINGTAFDGSANVSITVTAAQVSDATSAGRSMLTAADAAAQKVLLNLSGTNTGDQDLSGYATTASVSAGYQPLDADLTAIAALTTQTYGRGLLTQASASAARTTLELGNVNNTSDANKPVSTAAQEALDLKANLASPNLTGVPTAPTATVGTNTTQIATTAGIVAERAATATLSGKTISGASNTITDIAAANLTGTTLPSSIVNSSITGLGTVTTGTWNGTAIGLSYGGTGATNAAGARENLGLSEPSTNIFDTNSSRVLAAADDNQFITFQNATSTDVTIPVEASVPWSTMVPVPVIYIKRDDGAGPVTVAGSGVIIHSNAAYAIPEGGSFALRWRDTNEWDYIGPPASASGDLVAGPVTSTEGTSAIANGALSLAMIGDAGTLAGLSAIDSSHITNDSIVNDDINSAAAIALSKLAQNPLDRSLHTGTQAASTITALPYDFGGALGDETTDLTTGVKFTAYAHRALTITGFFGSVVTAPTGQSLIFDVKKNGVSIFSALPSIDATEFHTADGVAGTLSTTTFAVGDKIEIEITQVGNVVAGAGAKAVVLCTLA